MTNPYLRAAQKLPALRQQAAERLYKRPEHAGRRDSAPSQGPQRPVHSGRSPHS
jgi:hypothetical protein